MAVFSSRRRFLGGLAVGAVGISMSGCGSTEAGVPASSTASATSAAGLTPTLVLATGTPLPSGTSDQRVASSSAATSVTTVPPSPSLASATTLTISEGLKAGQKLPPFTLAGINGETISGAELTARGKAYILFFFATW